MFVKNKELFYFKLIMITRNLAICLGVTGLTSVLLFLYFRHRVGHVEEKMEALFQLIQKEARDSMNERIQFNEKMGATTQDENDFVEQEAPIELTQQRIEVSEDEDSESESDSESDSDSDSDDEGEKLLIQETPTPQIAEVLNDQIEEIELKHDVKEEVKEELSDKSGEGEDDNNSLDEVDLDDLEEEGETKEIKLEELVNYNDMKVADLKSLAAERQLSGYSHLKKKDLVELLSQNHEAHQ
tara:strand:- start:65 stop:790 length:726 start_codon:yes stop_codon:yes gene_type:complete